MPSVISSQYPLVSEFKKMILGGDLHVIKTTREHAKTEGLGLMSATLAPDTTDIMKASPSTEISTFQKDTSSPSLL